jgi:hypothetical protein
MINLEKIANDAFVDELEKISGVYSEFIGGGIGEIVPGAGLIGSLAALATPTKTHEQMLEQQKKKWSNFLPGVGTYRLMKRLGYSHKQLNKELESKEEKK